MQPADSKLLVTGGSDDGTVGSNDIDGGTTSALSQSIAVPADAGAMLSFKYTFAHLENSSKDDFFRVSVIGQNETKVVVEERGDKSNRAGQWQEFSVGVSEFAGQDIQILVEAADAKKSSLVEAGIDDVKVEIPASEMMIDGFTQAQHGEVTLNEDGTFNYVAEQGFTGEDEFQYTLTDGENVSNTATVKVHVEGKTFKVGSLASGDEDTSIALEIVSDYDLVRIEGVPEGATLNRGDPTNKGVYELTSDQLNGLAILPVENSDQDFQLKVTPVDNNVEDLEATATIDVVVNAVVDGGYVEFSDFGIVTGKNGKVPVASEFYDRDGSESHKITLTGLPEFVSLSKGEFDGTSWVVDAADLKKLKIEAEKVDDTSDWEFYDKKYVFKAFQVEFTVESFEEHGSDSSSFSDSFEMFAIQKK
jgi:VCBS repeat-containing protein